MHKRVNPDSCYKLLIAYLNEMIKHFFFPVLILLKYQVMCISVFKIVICYTSKGFLINLLKRRNVYQ